MRAADVPRAAAAEGAAKSSARDPSSAATSASKVPRGTARKIRRSEWALVRTRIFEDERPFWRPTFAEFAAIVLRHGAVTALSNAVAHKSRLDQVRRLASTRLTRVVPEPVAGAPANKSRATAHRAVHQVSRTASQARPDGPGGRSSAQRFGALLRSRSRRGCGILPRALEG